VRLSGRKTRCVVLAFVLLSVLSALTASNSLLHGTVLSVAAQTAPAASNTTVRNNVSVLSDSVSLGGSLRAEGVVTTPKGPLASVPVALHMGDIIVARTQTDANGEYAFSAPVGLNYVPAVLSGSATVYTVAEPTDAAFHATPSAVTNVPVNAIPAYGIVAGVTCIIVLVLYLYARPGTAGRRRDERRLTAPRQRFSRWTSRRALRQNERTEAASRPQEVPEPSVDHAASTVTESAENLPQQAPVAEHTPAVGDTALAATERTEAAPQPAIESEPASAREASAVRRARDLFAEGEDRQAVGLLYDAAAASLAKASTVTLLPSMTHWERYGAIEAAIPEARQPLRTLTVALERTHYGDKSLTEEQQNAAIAAFQSISASAEPVEANT
jgi:hypothetical protein